MEARSKRNDPRQKKTQQGVKKRCKIKKESAQKGPYVFWLFPLRCISRRIFHRAPPCSSPVWSHRFCWFPAHQPGEIGRQIARHFSKSRPPDSNLKAQHFRHFERMHLAIQVQTAKHGTSVLPLTQGPSGRYVMPSTAMVGFHVHT